MAFRVENVDWTRAKHRLMPLREKVFVYEWRIPPEVEFDQDDTSATHLLLKDEQGREIATARLTTKGEVGRIAVLFGRRKPAVYKALSRALQRLAKQQALKQLVVQCELEGVAVYEKQGFRPVGDVYMDAGIPRQRMACSLKKFSLSHADFVH